MDVKKLLLLVLCICCSPLYAEYGGWVTKDGKPSPNTDNMKSIKGFGGWLLITPDKDWATKWETPTETTPNFNEASEVRYGDQLAALTFFINPLLDSKRHINILCDIKVIRPDKTISYDNRNLDCASGVLNGDPRNVRLSNMIINFIGEDGDPAGSWVVEVNIIDKNRDVLIPLRAEFELISNEDNKPLN